MGNTLLNTGHNTTTGGGSNNDREHTFNVLCYYNRKIHKINIYPL